MTTSLAGRTADPCEATLVERAATGDATAFTTLHQRYQPMVFSVVRAEMRRGATAAEAEDVSQEVFTLAWQRLSSLRDPERFKAWLMQITRRSVIDHARKVARRPQLDGDDDFALGRHAHRGAGPVELTEFADLADRLRGALVGLSRRDATVVTMAAQFGFGPSEIGAALGMTPNNAKVVLHRARNRLRAALEG
ncbi:MAG: sigma-70 family RNA polymerase sigma factor [Microthrixaceae bacterium]